MSSFSLSLFKRYVSSSSSPFATPPNLSSMEQSFQLRRVDYIIFSKKEIVYLYLFFLSLFLFQSKPSARSCRSLGWAEWGQEVGGGDVFVWGGKVEWRRSARGRSVCRWCTAESRNRETPTHNCTHGTLTE